MTKILCIDEEPGTLKVYQKLFESQGYEVQIASTSEEALTILNSQSFDLVTQDFHRRGMDGFEFLKHIKEDEKLREIPVLAIAAGTREGQRNEGLEQYGLDIDRDLIGFISKPILPDELLKQVIAILSTLSNNPAS